LVSPADSGIKNIISRKDRRKLYLRMENDYQRISVIPIILSFLLIRGRKRLAEAIAESNLSGSYKYSKGGGESFIGCIQP
jgi:hypothetical protein